MPTKTLPKSIPVRLLAVALEIQGVVKDKYEHEETSIMHQVLYEIDLQERLQELIDMA